jgi:PilZ domain
MTPVTQRRRTTPRAAVQLEVQLERKTGTPVAARTVDLCAGGARVTCERPLRVDEELRFAVGSVDGMARVLRQDGHNQYALRFEGLAPDAVAQLDAFVQR